ncbi:MAG: adenosine deaminase, partial [Cyanobacteria bacterium REEB65]|nr:adenosine deaminase [Cyanobacteria bacterium REEB65]
MALDPAADLLKTDLHLHLDGAVRPQTLLALARSQGTPTGPLEAIFASPPDGDLPAYLQRFDLVLPFLQASDTLHRVGAEVVEDCAQNGTVYAEIRFCPLLHLQQGMPPEAVVEAVLAGIQEGQSRTGVVSRLILCILHGMTTQQADQIAGLAVRYRHEGVVAMDLAGKEVPAFDLSPFAPAFARVREAGLKVTVHAGEAGPGGNVTAAMTQLGAQRIGHGTRIFSDPRAVEL